MKTPKRGYYYSECAWCGADQPHGRWWLNRQGERFCSAAHRKASNAALSALREREAFTSALEGAVYQILLPPVMVTLGGGQPMLVQGIRDALLTARVKVQPGSYVVTIRKVRT